MRYFVRYFICETARAINSRKYCHAKGQSKITLLNIKRSYSIVIEFVRRPETSTLTFLSSNLIHSLNRFTV